jgi:TolB-like protein/class 3 adenylate cyclase
MAAKLKSGSHLEIAHVLFIDVVGYSKLLVNEQREVVEQLNRTVRKTPQFRKSEGAGKLIRIPVGDGMALVFFQTPEEPVQCAMEIARALKNHPSIRLRMGVHSGPVDQVKDVNDRLNVAGAGINIAQRVMDCGDAGHILVSKRVADDLAQDRLWQPHLHELGEVELKHGQKVGIVNLYTEELGNARPPEKFEPLKQKQDASITGRDTSSILRDKRALAVAAILLLAALAIGFWKFHHSAAPKLTSTSATMSEKSIAVLPFENLSEEKANAFFADGVQDEILTNLARIADLKVISRTSVMQYKNRVARNLHEIGQQLGVAHLVEGSVQRVANRVRVNAQLIDARTDAHLWAQTYDRDLADVFAIQSEIAKAIADQLQAELSPSEKTAIERPPTTDIAAFDLYTLAKNAFLTIPFRANRKGDYLQAIDRLNQAAVRDPSFFEAYCLLAHLHDDLYFFGIDHTPERLAQAAAAVEAAFRLRPDAGEAHLARAEHLYHGYRDYHGAVAELEIAHRVLPNNPYLFVLTGSIARRQGKFKEALPSYQRALELDPRNVAILQLIGTNYQMLRRYAETAAMLDSALAIKPDDVETKVVRAQVDLDWKADTRPLHQTIDEIHQKEPAAIQKIANFMLLCALVERDVTAAEAALAALGDNPFGHDEMYFSPKFNEGIVARLAKDENKARAAFALAREQQEKVVQAQPNYGPPLCMLAVIDGALGRKEDALREGRRATELLPVSKDSINGEQLLEYYAVVAAWAGEKDLALEQLQKAIRLPGYGITTYGQLKLLPHWDPLRGDPRFEQIVASLAPK